VNDAPGRFLPWETEATLWQNAATQKARREVEPYDRDAGKNRYSGLGGLGLEFEDLLAVGEDGAAFVLRGGEFPLADGGGGGGGEEGILRGGDGGHADGAGFIDVEIDGDGAAEALVDPLFRINGLGDVKRSGDGVEAA
jgi:hypothetical protein